MSEQNPETESDQPPIDSEVIASSSNGVHHDAAAAEAGEAAEADTAGGAGPAATDPGDDGSSFVNDLVRAMQKTAASERTRLTKDADRRREAHLATIQARREAEAQKMRQLADDDLKGIDAWAEEERQRVQVEHERRAAALRADLDTSLAEHGSRIDREVAEVEAAITAYRSDTDAYFASLDRESDPVEIARQARNRPTFPALEAIGRSEAEDVEPAAAGTNDTEAADIAAEAEPTEAIAADADDSAKSPEDDSAPATPAVAVMDPDAAARLAESWSTWSGLPADAPADAPAESTVEPATATVDDTTAPKATATATATVADDEFDLVSARTRVSSSGPTPLLQSVPISRPMSWLRRGGNSDRDSDGDRQDR